MSTPEHSDAFFAGLLAADADALGQLLAPDFLIVDVARGGVTNRDEFVAAVRTGMVRFDEIAVLRLSLTYRPRRVEAGKASTAASSFTRKKVVNAGKAHARFRVGGSQEETRYRCSRRRCCVLCGSDYPHQCADEP